MNKLTWCYAHNAGLLSYEQMRIQYTMALTTSLLLFLFIPRTINVLVNRAARWVEVERNEMEI